MRHHRVLVYQLLVLFFGDLHLFRVPRILLRVLGVRWDIIQQTLRRIQY